MDMVFKVLVWVVFFMDYMLYKVKQGLIEKVIGIRQY